MDPMTMGLVSQVGGQFLQGLFKPKYNPYMQMQQEALNAQRRMQPYHQKMMQNSIDQYERYKPIHDKMTNMSIESAMKPLTSTDMFKGVGPLAGILQQQGDAASTAATNTANASGLYGGARAGLQQSATNANNAAITKSLSDFAGNYEANAPQRMAMAAGAAGNQVQAGQAGADSSANNLMNLYGSMQQGMGNLANQWQSAQDASAAGHAGLMQAIGGYFGQQAGNRQFDKALNAQSASNRQYANNIPSGSSNGWGVIAQHPDGTPIFGSL